MYPVIHALRLGADLSSGEAKDPDTTTFTCPDQAWVTFEVRRVRKE